MRERLEEPKAFKWRCASSASDALHALISSTFALRIDCRDRLKPPTRCDRLAPTLRVALRRADDALAARPCSRRTPTRNQDGRVVVRRAAALPPGVVQGLRRDHRLALSALALTPALLGARADRAGPDNRGRAGALGARRCCGAGGDTAGRAGGRRDGRRGGGGRGGRSDRRAERGGGRRGGRADERARAGAGGPRHGAGE